VITRFIDRKYTNLPVSELAKTNLMSYLATSAGVTKDRVTICDVQQGSTIVWFYIEGQSVDDVNASSVTEAVLMALGESERLRSILGSHLINQQYNR